MTSYSFEIRGATDLMRAFLAAVDQYLAEPLCSMKAVVCAMLAWHLADWIYCDYSAISDSFREPSDFRRYLKSQCGSLSYMQDITNGTKHRSITKYTPAISGTEKHSGAFSSDFSKGFDISCLRIALADGTLVYFDEEIQKVRDFWKSYFSNTLKENV